MFNSSNVVFGTPKPMFHNSNVFLHPISSSTKIPTMLHWNLSIRCMKPGGEDNYTIRQSLKFPADKTIGTIKPCNFAVAHVQYPPQEKISAPSLHDGHFGLPKSTLGRYLAQRLVQIGVNDVFGVPGDSNLTLLDHFVAEPGITLVGCCNELNAGYAAEGYARSRGVGACVFTFTVGGLSALNAIAGAYSENLPVICIVGGPNSNYYGKNVILHHTIGLKDFSQELKCFETVTCYQAVVNNLEDAQEQIDAAIKAALSESKPVYISISSNLASTPHPSFSLNPISLLFTPRISNRISLEAAVHAATEFLNKAAQPVLIGGDKLRAAKASEAFVELADACGYAMTVMPAAKGLVPENHPHFIGPYWGAASAPYCAKIVELADAYLYVGPIFDSISTLGFSTSLEKEKMIIVHLERVVIGNTLTFGGVFMKDFLEELSKRIHRNTTSYNNYRLMYVPEGLHKPRRPNEALKVNILFKHIQKMVSSESDVIAETGDSWFHSQKLKLPQGCRYEAQMHYASIGWSVGATLGYAQAAPHRRVIACIGDGSFQMAAQEVSTMLRCGQRSIIFLINNGGYSTEVQIHDGPYNDIKKWDYTMLVSAIHNGKGNCWATKVQCEEELIAALEMAMGEKKECLCFIELIVDKNDTSKELIELASRLAAVNSFPPALVE